MWKLQFGTQNKCIGEKCSLPIDWVHIKEFSYGVIVGFTCDDHAEEVKKTIDSFKGVPEEGFNDVYAK